MLQLTISYTLVLRYINRYIHKKNVIFKLITIPYLIIYLLIINNNILSMTPIEAREKRTTDWSVQREGATRKTRKQMKTKQTERKHNTKTTIMMIRMWEEGAQKEGPHKMKRSTRAHRHAVEQEMPTSELRSQSKEHENQGTKMLLRTLDWLRNHNQKTDYWKKKEQTAETAAAASRILLSDSRATTTTIDRYVSRRGTWRRLSSNEESNRNPVKICCTMAQNLETGEEKNSGNTAYVAGVLTGVVILSWIR
jgi:hypothetical protein